MSGVGRGSNNLSRSVVLFCGILLAALILFQITGLYELVADTLSNITSTPAAQLTELSWVIVALVSVVLSIYAFLNQEKAREDDNSYLNQNASFGDFNEIRHPNRLYASYKSGDEAGEENTNLSNDDQAGSDDGYGG